MIVEANSHNIPFFHITEKGLPTLEPHFTQVVIQILFVGEYMVLCWLQKPIQSMRQLKKLLLYCNLLTVVTRSFDRFNGTTLNEGRRVVQDPNWGPNSEARTLSKLFDWRPFLHRILSFYDKRSKKNLREHVATADGDHRSAVRKLSLFWCRSAANLSIYGMFLSDISLEVCFFIILYFYFWTLEKTSHILSFLFFCNSHDFTIMNFLGSLMFIYNLQTTVVLEVWTTCTFFQCMSKLLQESSNLRKGKKELFK